MEIRKSLTSAYDPDRNATDPRTGDIVAIHTIRVCPGCRPDLVQAGAAEDPCELHGGGPGAPAPMPPATFWDRL